MATYTTTSGKTVTKPFNKIWIVLGVLIVLVIAFWQFINFDPTQISISELGVILKKMFTPKQSLTAHRTWGDYFAFMLTLWEPIKKTIQMSFAGSIIGSLLAFPVAILAARNIFKSKIINAPIKFLMNLLRTIPAMILALIGVSFVGTGVLSGIIGLSLFSFGIMAKMLYEAIEVVDMNPFEALESTGANKLQAFRYSVIPQIAPTFVSYLIYIFELNIRASAILGFVGIVGIGLVISDNILYNYDRVGAAVLVLLVLILTIQFFSSYVRRKLL